MDNVIDFRELLVHILNFKLDKVSDNFTFAIGGTAHAVIPSKRGNGTIAMNALPPTMKVNFGATSSDFMDKVKENLVARSIPIH